VASSHFLNSLIATHASTGPKQHKVDMPQTC
jgi:hypothetical protein